MMPSSSKANDENVISVYVQEEHKYSITDLMSLFQLDEKQIQKFIKALKHFNILKVGRYSAYDQADMSDMLDDNIIFDDDFTSNKKYYYAFTYVGIVAKGNLVLKIYPKYLPSNSKPVEEMKQVIKVLKKYKKSKRQEIDFSNALGDDNQFNLLPVILYLIDDYYENGIYSKDDEIVEHNGEGRILWGRTIDQCYPIIKNNCPYYLDYLTLETVDDNDNYITKLHQAVITECFRILKETELDQLFGYEQLILTEDTIDDFGEPDDIFYRITLELNEQYNTQKQILLQTIYAFIDKRKKLLTIPNGISMYGSSAFNLIWEEACGKSFKNYRDLPLNKLSLNLSGKQKYRASNTLLDIIERPKWIGSRFGQMAKGTLKPDILTFYCSDGQSYFVILDAKYYVISWSENKAINGQPGIPDISKQYLYQLAFKDFINDFGFTGVKNIFLLPTSDNAVKTEATVKMQILSSLGLEDIIVKLVPAADVFNSYLTETPLDISMLGID